MDEQYTRCPGCRTIFRVTAQQLALKGGQVRCGHCRTVFDGTAELVSLAPQPHEARDVEADQGPPTVTLRPAHALRAADDTVAPATATHAATTQSPSPPTITPGTVRADDDWENRFA